MKPLRGSTKGTKETKSKKPPRQKQVHGCMQFFVAFVYFVDKAAYRLPNADLHAIGAESVLRGIDATVAAALTCRQASPLQCPP